MKVIVWLVLILVLVMLFGAVPLNILSKMFEWLSTATGWLGSAVDFFGWGGVVN